MRVAELFEWPMAVAMPFGVSDKVPFSTQARKVSKTVSGRTGIVVSEYLQPLFNPL